MKFEYMKKVVTLLDGFDVTDVSVHRHRSYSSDNRVTHTIKAESKNANYELALHSDGKVTAKKITDVVISD